MPEEAKTCAYCGRRMEWRAKWKDCWDEVKFCSERCRRSTGKSDREIEAVMLELLAERAPGATICPSEVARRFFGEDEWRGQMEVVRCAARRLVAKGELEITQKGRVVDPSTAKGPIRLRRRGR